MAREVSARIADIPEVEVVLVDGGTSGETKANLVIGFGQKEDRERSSFAISDDIAAKLVDYPDARIFVVLEDGSRDISVNVLGDDVAKTADAARALASQINALDEVENGSSAASLVRPEKLPEVPTETWSGAKRGWAEALPIRLN